MAAKGDPRRQLISDFMLKIFLILSVASLRSVAQQTGTYRCYGIANGNFNIEFVLNNPNSETVTELAYYYANDNQFLTHEYETAAECSTTSIVAQRTTFTLADIDANNLKCGGFRTGATCRWAVRSIGDISTDTIFVFSCCENELLNQELQATIMTNGIEPFSAFSRSHSLRFDILDLENWLGPVYFPATSVLMGSALKLRLSFHKGFQSSRVDNCGPSFHLAFDSLDQPSQATLKLFLYSKGTGNNVRVTYIDPTTTQLTSETIPMYYDSYREYELPWQLAGGSTISSWQTETKGVLVEGLNDDVCIKVSACTLSSCATYVPLPDDAIGTQYTVINTADTPLQVNAGSISRSQAVVIATSNAVTVTITSPSSFTGTATITNAGNTLTFAQGQQVQITLNQLETFHMISANDLSGTVISANQPISVIGGNQRELFGAVGDGLADKSLTQYAPRSSAARKYVFLVLPDAISDGAVYIVNRANPGPSISLLSQIDNGPPISLVNDVTGIDIPSTAPAGGYEVHITADVLVTQAVPSDGAGSTSMMMVPSIQQWGHECLFFKTPGTSHYLIVVTLVASAPTLNGVDITTGMFPSEPILPVNPGAPRYVRYLITSMVTMEEKILVRQAVGDEHKSLMCVLYERNAATGAIGANLPFNLGFPQTYECARKDQHASPMGDGEDNDCDGETDEEIYNNLDDDGDGLIDEDLAVTLPDETGGSFVSIYNTKLEISNNANFDATGTNRYVSVVDNSCNNFGSTTAPGSIGTFSEVANLGSDFVDYFILETLPFKAFRLDGGGENLMAYGDLYIRATVEFSNDPDVISNLPTCPVNRRRRSLESRRTETYYTVIRVENPTNSTTEQGSGPTEGGAKFGDCTRNLGFWALAGVLGLLVLTEALVVSGMVLYRRRVR